MNIYVPTRCVDYYMDSLLCGLTNGNQIMLGDNIYKERNPIDVILIDNNPLTDDLVKFLSDRAVPVAIINQTTNPPVFPISYRFSPISQDGHEFLPPFANTTRYQPAIPVERYRSDILLVVSNEEEAKLANQVYTEKFQTEKKIKIVGPVFARSPGFVGVVDNASLMAYAKSASVVLVENEIIRNSMLFYSIYALPMGAYKDELLDSKERDKYVRNEKIQLVTEKKIADIINEKLRNINN